MEGELLDLINQIKDRKAKHTIRSLHLIVDDTGQKLSYFMLQSHFDKTRELAGVRKIYFSSGICGQRPTPTRRNHQAI